MKFMLLIFILNFSLLILSQENQNPWLVKEGENPWKTEYSEENPWSEQGNGLVNEIDSTQITSIDSTTNFKTSQKEVLNQDLKLSLFVIKEQSRENFNGRNAFLSGFIPCAFLSFYMIIPVMIGNVLPSINQSDAVNEFERKNPKANSEQINAVKKGIRSKRVSRSMAGAGYGMLTNLVAIIVIVIASFN